MIRLSAPPAVACVLIAAISAACRDSTGVDDGVVVEIALDAEPAPLIRETPAGPRMECSVGLSARARGAGTATWHDAQFHWFIGANRTTPTESSSIPDHQVQNAWGSPSIAGGEARHGVWNLSAGAPFEVVIGFRYRTTEGGPVSTATTRVKCGPTPQVGPSPVVTQLEPVTPTGELQVGDTISLTYAVSSAGGLWATSLTVSGAFDEQRIFAERFATNVTRTVKIAVPQGSSPGAAVSVAVGAFDAALQSGSRTLTTNLTVVDRTPPVLVGASMHHGLGRPLGMGLAGEYAAGDAMTLYVSAYDNNALGYVVYELGAPANFRDSIAAGPRQSSRTWVFNVQARPEWVGAPLLGVYVRDASGLTSVRAQSATDSIRVYPVVDRPMRVLPLSDFSEITDVIYDARRDAVYLTNSRQNRIDVLTVTSMAFQPSIQLPAQPWGIDLSPTGDSLLVAIPTSKSLTVVDLTKQPAVPSTLAMPLLDTAGTSHSAVTPAPIGLRIAANGKAIVLLSYNTRSGDQVVEVDLGTGAQRIRTDARSISSSSFLPRAIGRTDDRKRIYMLGTGACARRYDSSSDTFTACTGTVTSNGNGLTFDAAGSRFTYGEHLLDTDMRIIWSAEPIAGYVPRAALSPEGDTVYFGAGATLTKARATDRRKLERVALPFNAEWLFVAPSGDWALVLQSTYPPRVARVDLR